MTNSYKLLIPALIAGLSWIYSCNDVPTTTINDNTLHSDTMKKSIASSITQEKFGSVNGQDIIQFTITNPAGMIVKIINYGATVTNILVPDTTGQWGDVVLGFDGLEGYLQKENPYFGCTVGRYANRIANGKFSVNGKEYQLALNNNGNALHGGEKNFSRVVWSAMPLPGDSSIKMTYYSKDGEEGYPGNLYTQVIFTVTPSNELKIDYSATTDKETPINLTNHSYFNLSAGKDSTVLGHDVLINADRFTVANDKLIPTGELAPVKGTSMDFNVPMKVGSDIEKVAGGYDHNWVLNKKGGEGPELAATVYHPGTGRYMEMFTTEPGVQFYTANFLDGSLAGKGGKPYVKHSGLCLEAQHFPDSPNQPSFPNTLLKPGDTYKQTTIYKFSTK